MVAIVSIIQRSYVIRYLINMVRVDIAILGWYFIKIYRYHTWDCDFRFFDLYHLFHLFLMFFDDLFFYWINSCIGLPLTFLIGLGTLSWTFLLIWDRFNARTNRWCITCWLQIIVLFLHKTILIGIGFTISLLLGCSWNIIKLLG